MENTVERLDIVRASFVFLISFVAKFVQCFYVNVNIVVVFIPQYLCPIWILCQHQGPMDSLLSGSHGGLDPTGVQILVKLFL